MRKRLLLFLLFLSATLGAQAQEGFFSQIRLFGRQTTQTQQITKQLAQQVESSFQKACEFACSEQTYHLLTSGPSKYMRQPLYSSPTQLYPNATFITTPEQLSSYFLVQQNKNITHQLPKLQQLRDEILANLENFEKTKQVTLIPEEETPAAWLVDQLQDDLEYLLLGEVHYYPEIQPQIVNMIRSLRHRYPDRQIILFTEFLLENETWDMAADLTINYKEYQKVWIAAQVRQIQSIGLEPAFVEKDHVRLHYRPPIQTSWLASSRQQNIWASLEGMRLRNTRWLQTLKTYRAQYPHALFIIYAGEAHVSYNEPYSIGTALGNKKIKVINFDNNFSLGTNSTLTTPFDHITSGRFTMEKLTDKKYGITPILHFPDKHLSRLAGFDYSVKVTIFPHD